MRGAALLVLLLALGAGCTFGLPEELPWRGPVPAILLTLPVAGTGGREVAAALEAALPEALRARGYYAVPAEVGTALLRPRGLGEYRAVPAGELAAVARELGVDAFVTIRVERWDAAWAPTLVSLDYDIGYRIWSAADGALLWQVRRKGSWTWDPGPPLYDPNDALQKYLGPVPSDPDFSPYESDYDIARVLHRDAMERLPRR